MGPANWNNQNHCVCTRVHDVCVFVSNMELHRFGGYTHVTNDTHRFVPFHFYAFLSFSFLNVIRRMLVEKRNWRKSERFSFDRPQRTHQYTYKIYSTSSNKFVVLSRQHTTHRAFGVLNELNCMEIKRIDDFFPV